MDNGRCVGVLSDAMATRHSKGNPTHRVTLCKYADPAKRATDGKGRGLGGGRRKLWAFSWEDLAALYGVPVRTVQSWTRERHRHKNDPERCRWLRGPILDPTDLGSIVLLAKKRDYKHWKDAT